MNVFKRFYTRLTTRRCKHIWKEGHRTYLRSFSKPWCLGGGIEFDYFDVYAVQQACVCCPATRTLEAKQLA